MSKNHQSGPLADLIRWLRRPVQGLAGIASLGHRGYVGGRWDEIGNLQFNFLVDHGLRPDSVLLDIACGSLRLGCRAIPYLAPGHYLGIEKEAELLRAGLEQELGAELAEQQRPSLLVDDRFNFDRLGVVADVAIAHSLFTHLPAEPIGRCFRQLRPWLRPDGVFYATYFPSQRRRRQGGSAHDHGYFAYTEAEIVSFGEGNGFSCELLGDWGHPRGQIMAAYRPTP